MLALGALWARPDRPPPGVASPGRRRRRVRHLPDRRSRHLRPDAADDAYPRARAFLNTLPAGTRVGLTDVTGEFGLLPHPGWGVWPSLLSLQTNDAQYVLTRSHQLTQGYGYAAPDLLDWLAQHATPVFTTTGPSGGDTVVWRLDRDALDAAIAAGQTLPPVTGGTRDALHPRHRLVDRRDPLRVRADPQTLPRCRSECSNAACTRRRGSRPSGRPGSPWSSCRLPGTATSPTPGQVDPAYVAEVHRKIDACRAAGMRIVLGPGCSTRPTGCARFPTPLLRGSAGGLPAHGGLDLVFNAGVRDAVSSYLGTWRRTCRWPVPSAVSPPYASAPAAPAELANPGPDAAGAELGDRRRWFGRRGAGRRGTRFSRGRTRTSPIRGCPRTSTGPSAPRPRPEEACRRGVGQPATGLGARSARVARCPRHARAGRRLAGLVHDLPDRHRRLAGGPAARAGVPRARARARRRARGSCPPAEPRPSTGCSTAGPTPTAPWSAAWTTRPVPGARRAARRRRRLHRHGRRAGRDARAGPARTAAARRRRRAARAHRPPPGRVSADVRARPRNNLALVGENPGPPDAPDTGGDPASDNSAQQLQHAPGYARECGMTEFYWAFEDDLFAPGSGVDLDDLRSRIAGAPGRGDRRVRVLHLGFEDPAMPGAGGGSLRTHEINRRLSPTAWTSPCSPPAIPAAWTVSRTASPTSTSAPARAARG